MNRFPVPALLVLVLGLAAALREAPAAGYELPAGERVVRGLDGAGAELAVALPRWLVDDPDAAYHLRRVELALADGHVPARDRFLNHPHGSAVPWPPFLDGVLAWVARAALDTDGAPHGEAALGGRSEEELEALLVHVPTILGVLTSLALFLAVRSMCRADTGAAWAPDVAGLVAAAIYACLPIATWYGGVTRVDHHVLIALFMAVHLGLLGWTLRARELTDATLGALLAGLVGGCALLSWLAAAVFVGLGGAVLLARALSDDRDEAASACRAGILYFLAAAVVTLVPASNSPWNEVQPGSLINLTDGVPRALLAGCAPFVAMLLAARAGRGRPVQAAAAAAALAAVVILLPGFLAGARAGFAWASRQNEFMAIVAESQPLFGGRPWWGTAVGDLTPLVFLFPAAWLALAPSWRRPDRLFVLASAAAFCGLTLTQRRFGNSLAVPFAATFALALHDRLAGAAAGGARFPRVLFAGSALVLAVVLVFGTSPLRTPAAELADLRDWRAERLAGLRWMRAGTPAPGAWNAPEARQDYGVLAVWGDGHLIEYHARRPSITTNFGSFVGEEGYRRAASALLATTPEELDAAMLGLDAEYLVVGPRSVGGLNTTLQIAGVPASERGAYFQRTPRGKTYGERALATALWRLALTPPDVDPEHWPGLRLVYRSSRRETLGGTRPRPGEPAGPVISIYRLTTPPGAPPGATLQPR